MRDRLLLTLLLIGALGADSWTLGLGVGRSDYLGTSSPVPDRPTDLFVAQRSWRLEAEVGYYSGRRGFDVLGVYGETFVRSPDRTTLFRDQHLALLAEYRLFVLNNSGTVQGAVGLGPSLHRVGYYTPSDRWHYPVYLSADAEVSGLVFASRHFLIRGELCYSFRPRYPLLGIVALTLRLAWRS